MNVSSPTTKSSPRLRRLAGVLTVGLALVALASAGIASAAPDTSAQPTSVSLTLTPGPQGTVDQTFQVVADLAPSTAYGDVTLTDNGVVVGQGMNYRNVWTWTHQGMAVGVHHLVLTFDTSVDSDAAYTASTATATYTVAQPAAVAATSATATPKPKPTDTQPIGVTIPNHGGTGPTKTTAPPTSKSGHPTPTHSQTSSPPSGTAPNGTGKSPGGSNLPSTGFDALLATAVAMVLLAAGTSMIGAARRKRRAS